MPNESCRSSVFNLYFNNMESLILYTLGGDQSRLNLRSEAGSAWLTQAETAKLFQTTKQNMSLHAKNILSDGELAKNSAVKDSLTADNYCLRQELPYQALRARPIREYGRL